MNRHFIRHLGILLVLVLLSVAFSASALADEVAAVAQLGEAEPTVGEVEAVGQGPVALPERSDAEAEALSNGSTVAINKKNFPDEGFRYYILYAIDKNGDGKLSKSEISGTTTIELGIMDEVGSLKGIERFTNLKTLEVEMGDFSSVDLKKLKKLERLALSACEDLKKLDVSKNTKLKELYCDSCALKNLDLSKNTKLEKLNCRGNNLTKLNLSKNTKLTWLDCGDNKLTKLDLSKNTKLDTLVCDSNKLTSLSLAKNKQLTWLEAQDNKITALDLSKNTKLEDAFVLGDSLKTVKACVGTTLRINTLDYYYYDVTFSDWYSSVPSVVAISSRDGYVYAKCASKGSATIYYRKNGSQCSVAVSVY